MLPFNKPKNYTTHYEYRDFNDVLVGYIVRIDHAGKKRFSPWTQDVNGEWVNKWHDTPTKHIYREQNLKKHPNAPVLIVEGEKAADKAQELFPAFVVVTWVGGANAAHKANLTHLVGRDVTIWPDNDEPGKKAAQTLAGLLPNARIVDVDALRLPEKWDLGDTIDRETDELLIAILSAKAPRRELSGWPYLTANGTPMNMPQNLLHLFEFYGITAQYNEISRQTLISIPQTAFCAANQLKLSLAHITALAIKHALPTNKLDEWVALIADNHRFNPVRDFIESKPWDGVHRIQTLCESLDCADPDFSHLLIKKWLVGAVASGLSESGEACHGVLTLLGEQGCGKSTWVRSLLPQGSELLLADCSFSPTDKDSISSATAHWITELAEVDGMTRRADVSAVKAFLTRKLDVYRAPYDRAATHAPRRTAFCATVNSQSFLRDDTGNRRWWVIQVNRADAHHGLDTQQVWAEAKVLLDAGYPYHLTTDELKHLNQRNEEFDTVSPVAQLISERYDWDCDKRLWTNPKPVMQILVECGYREGQIGRQEINEAHTILKKLGNNPVMRRGTRTYYLPAFNSYYMK